MWVTRVTRDAITREKVRAKRDTQKFRLYRAENAAGITTHACDMDIVAAQSYVRGLCRSAWARKHAPEIAAPRGVLVISGNGNNANGSRIMLTVKGRNRGTILHELAHVIETRRYGYVTNPWHGREYAAIYLALVRRFLGKDAYLKLRAEFKANKVRYAAPRKKRTGVVVGNPDALRVWREAQRNRVAAKAAPVICEVCVDRPAEHHYAFRDVCDVCYDSVRAQEKIAESLQSDGAQ